MHLEAFCGRGQWLEGAGNPELSLTQILGPSPAWLGAGSVWVGNTVGEQRCTCGPAQQPGAWVLQHDRQFTAAFPL